MDGKNVESTSVNQHKKATTVSVLFFKNHIKQYNSDFHGQFFRSSLVNIEHR
jgi:hypothetical protein